MSGSDLLSQDEIDALLNGVDDGDVDTEASSDVSEDGIVVYDFMSQDRIVGGKLPTLEMINERFGREFQMNLASMLQCDCRFTVGKVSIEKYSDYLDKLIVPTCLKLVTVDPLPGLGILLVDPNLVFAVVDQFFGGDGRMHSKVEGRDFTETELSIIDEVLRQVFEDLEDAWEPTMKLKFEFLRSELNPQFANISTPTEAVVVSRFKVDLEGVGGEIHVVYPYSMLDPIKETLNSGVQSEVDDPERRWEKSLRRDIELTDIEVSSTLAEVDLTVSELVELKVGDVIPFNYPEIFSLDVENVSVLSGVFGESDGQAAMKIVEWIKPETSTELVVRK